MNRFEVTFDKYYMTRRKHKEQLKVESQDISELINEEEHKDCI